MKDVSFGQYYPVKSVVHRLDPRTKLVLVVAYMVMLFFIPTVSRYLARGGTLNEYMLLAGVCYAAALVFVAISVLLSRVPLRSVLRSLRGILFVLIFMMVISMLFYSGSEAAGSWNYKLWIFKISKEGLINAGSMAMRLIFLVLGPSLLTLTTTPVALTDGIESLLTPFKWIKLPVHEFAIIMSIALRLIPTIAEETGKIINAQKARCADFDSGNIFKKAKALMPVLIPLFVSSFRRADELADAMDSRCYRGSKGRTRMKKLRFSFRDLLSLIFFAAVFTFVLSLRYDWFSLAAKILGLLF